MRQLAQPLILFALPLLALASENTCPSITRPNIGNLNREWSQWTDCSSGIEESIRQRVSYSDDDNSQFRRGSRVVETAARSCCNRNDVNKLIVVSGYSHADRNARSRSEVFDVGKHGLGKKICASPPRFPVARHGSVGGLLHNKFPIVCGGASPHGKSCYVLSKGNWVESTTMLESRVHPAAIILHEGATLFVIGGRNEKKSNLHLKSTEFVTMRGSHQGPPMPDAHYAGCFVKFNDTSALAMGGHNGKTFRQSTFFYNIQGNSWGRGPNVNVPRYVQACGMITDSSKADLRYVVMAGGSDGTYISSTEVWVVGSPSWTWGPELPPSKNYDGSAMVQEPDGKGALLIGGCASAADNPNIYRLKCFFGNCGWNRLGQELAVPRCWHTVMLVPSSLVECADDDNFIDNSLSYKSRRESGLTI